jgi:hypothetical protein
VPTDVSAEVRYPADAGAEKLPEKIQQIAPCSATHFEQPQTQISNPKSTKRLAMARWRSTPSRRVERVVAPDITRRRAHSPDSSGCQPFLPDRHHSPSSPSNNDRA